MLYSSDTPDARDRWRRDRCDVLNSSNSLVSERNIRLYRGNPFTVPGTEYSRPKNVFVEIVSLKVVSPESDTNEKKRHLRHSGTFLPLHNDFEHAFKHKCKQKELQGFSAYRNYKYITKINTIQAFQNAQKSFFLKIILNTLVTNILTFKIFFFNITGIYNITRLFNSC